MECYRGVMSEPSAVTQSEPSDLFQELNTVHFTLFILAPYYKTRNRFSSVLLPLPAKRSHTSRAFNPFTSCSVHEAVTLAHARPVHDSLHTRAILVVQNSTRPVGGTPAASCEITDSIKRLHRVRFIGVQHKPSHA